MKYIWLILLLLSVVLLIPYVYSVEPMTNSPIDIQLVVSRYNEDLEWLKEEPFHKYPVICYNKGPNDKFYKPDKMTIVKTENVGRCDHTYLYHIVKNYDNLAKHTVFLPGSCDMENKNHKAKRWIHEIEKSNRAVFIGVNVEKGIKQELYDFHLNEWAASNDKNKTINPESQLKLSSIRPFGKWYEKHFGDTHVHYLTYLGVFAIDRDHIVQHPKHYYENFLTELDGHTNPEVGHYFERAWAAIFHPMKDVIFIHQ
jgi:Protein of unknown function (DUF3431)